MARNPLAGQPDFRHLPIAHRHPAIAQKLGVAHLLEGSVRKAGNRVRIIAQLIEVASEVAQAAQGRGVRLPRSLRTFRDLHDDPRWRACLAKIGLAA